MIEPCWQTPSPTTISSASYLAILPGAPRTYVMCGKGRRDAGCAPAVEHRGELAHVSPHPTTKQSHVKFARDFVDSCPTLSRAANPHSSLQTRAGGVSFLVVGAPPPYSVNRHPLPRPQTRLGGGFLLSFLPPPMPPCAAPLPVDALALRAASAPPPTPCACALCVNTSPCAVPRALPLR